MHTTDCVVMVWFRAERARDDEVARLLAALGERMAADHGVDSRAGWRDETGYRTWLETYEPVAPESCDAFIDALQAHAFALGLGALAPQGRHVEVFRWCGR